MTPSYISTILNKLIFTDKFIVGHPAFVLTITRSKNDAGPHTKGYDRSSVIDPCDRYDQRRNAFGHSVAFRSQAEQRRDDYSRRHGSHYRSSDTNNNHYSVPDGNIKIGSNKCIYRIKNIPAEYGELPRHVQ